jgi:hypothetical protein
MLTTIVCFASLGKGEIETHVSWRNACSLHQEVSGVHAARRDSKKLLKIIDISKDKRTRAGRCTV